MGAGYHGGFGPTQGSSIIRFGNYKKFKLVEYVGSVKVGNIVCDVSRRVYQRNDINFLYIDKRTGRTNLELMISGKAPIGRDGRQIELHHVIQNEKGPVVEIHESTHREFSRQLHGLRKNGESFRRDKKLLKQFNNFRKAYWKWRASEYLKGIQ